MGRCIAKLADDKYVEWSSIVDAPVTYILTRDHMLAHLDAEYGRSSFDENRRCLDRADKNGTSIQGMEYSVEDLVSSNRAGKNGDNITLPEILEMYDLKNAEENGDIV